MSHINAINDSAQFAESVHKIKQSVIIQKAAGCFGQLLGGVFIAAGIALIANGASEYSEAETVDQLVAAVCESVGDVDATH